MTTSQEGNSTNAAATDVVPSFTINAAQETPTPAPVAATPPTLTVVGTPVAITRSPCAAIASSVAIGVNKTNVMVALKNP